MPKRVVDVLEVIEVKIQNRDDMMPTFRQTQSFVQFLMKQRPIGESRQRIVFGQGFEFFLGVFPVRNIPANDNEQTGSLILVGFAVSSMGNSTPLLRRPLSSF